jgi:hypothetical protein
VPFGEGERNPVLTQVVADGNLAAERVAAPLDGELAQIIRAGLHQHRHVERRQPQHVRHALFVAKVGQADEHALDAIAVPAKQLGARLRVLPGFNRAELGFVLAEDDRLDIERLKQRDQIATGFRHELIGEEVAVADDHGQRVGCHLRASGYFRAKMPN